MSNHQVEELDGATDLRDGDKLDAPSQQEVGRQAARPPHMNRTHGHGSAGCVPRHSDLWKCAVCLLLPWC